MLRRGPSVESFKRIPSSPQWLVYGGVFTGMDFVEVVDGTYEEHGPFDSYEEAVGVWRDRVGLNIDICEHRLYVERLK